MLKNKKDKLKAKNEDILEDEPHSDKNDGYGADKSRVAGKRSESVEKRKKAKEMDRAARWSGLVMLVILMMVGFLLWVSGEMKKEKQIDSNSKYDYVTPGYTDEY